MEEIDWDEHERLITPCEGRIKSRDLYDDDNIHQFSEYQHSFYEPMARLEFFGNGGYGQSVNIGEYKS
jgi:hypothetical protein